MFTVLTFCARKSFLQTCLGTSTTKRNMGIALVMIYWNFFALLYSNGKGPFSSCLSFPCLMTVLYHM